MACNDKNREFLSSEWFKEFIKIYRRLNFNNYIILTGGEPFLNMDSLLTAVTLFNREKFNIEILTSGVWFEKNPEYLNKLVENGRFSLRISLDSEHERVVSLKTISSLIRYSLNLKIVPHFTIREVPNSTNNVDYYRSFLKTNHSELFYDNIENSRWLHIIPHINIPKKSLKTSSNKKLNKKCFLGFKDLIIGADSMLYPCCGLFSLKNHRNLSVGNPLKLSYEEIIDIFNKREIFKILKDEGPHKLSKKSDNIIHNCSTICELCLKLLERL